jgi:hypothetical protein
VLTGLPHAVWVALGRPGSPLLLARVWAAALSLGTDLGLGVACRALHVPLAPALLAHASAWPILALAPRPLSNTLEAALVAALWAAVVRGVRSGRGAFALGALAAAGTFVRITFPLFACVPLLAALGMHALSAGADAGSKRGAFESNRAVVVREAATRFAAALAAGAVAAGLGLGFLDAFLAGGGAWFHAAPWRNLVYNLSPANLASHGAHPLGTSLGVYLPAMAPLAVPALLAWAVRAWRAVGSGVRALWRDAADARERALDAAPRRPAAAVAPATVLLASAALSLAVHQEARFLVPLMAPAALVAAEGRWAPGAADAGAGWRPRLAWTVLAVNVVAAVALATVHQVRACACVCVCVCCPERSSPTPARPLRGPQAGVVPTLGAMERALHDTAGVEYVGSSAPRAVVWYETYSPPESLLQRGPGEGPDVVDVAGDTAALRCQVARWAVDALAGPDSPRPLWLAFSAPAQPAVSAALLAAERAVRGEALDEALCRGATAPLLVERVAPGARVRPRLVGGWGPHVSAEALPRVSLRDRNGLRALAGATQVLWWEAVLDRGEAG